MAARLRQDGPAWLGAAAPVVYAAAVVAGGAMQPGYDHLALPISALMAGGTGGVLLNGLFALYNLMLLGFAAWLALRAGTAGFRAAGWMLGLCAAVGLLLLVAPMDPIGAAPTATGTAHLALAGLASLASMAGIGAGALGWRQMGEAGRARLSWAALGLVLVTGALAALAAGGQWPLAGLLERLTIGSFLAWVLWTALALRRRLPAA